MKIFSIGSSIVNEKLKKEQSTIETLSLQSIVSAVYYKNIVDKKVQTKLEVIENVGKNYDYIIIDLISLLQEHIRYKGEIVSKSKGIDESERKDIKKIEENTADIFVEVVNIIINSLIDKYHISKIILLNFEINNIENINDNSENIDSLKITNNNKLLKKIYMNLLKQNPGINTSKKIHIFYYEKEDKYEIRESILDKIDFNKDIFKNERIHKSLKNIRYYFEEAKLFNKDKLIIVFSAFSKDKPKYNYVNTLKMIDCNKLYILDDYGEKGCYYLGLDGNFDIETSVISLISNIMREKKVRFDNVISIGSSKGGSAAIYYGFKYNFKEVIVGAPQYKVGTYLTDLSIKTYGKDIFGELTESNRIKYDNLIRKVISSNSYTKISILTSDGDNQYIKVLKDIELILKSNNIDFTIDKCDIDHHNEIAKVFTNYVYNKIVHSLNKKGCIDNKYIKINKITKWLKK